MGVELRDKSIRVVFIWQGKQRREKLDLRPTPANIKYAERLVAEIKSKISVGTFDYAATFPNSRHAAESATDTPTFADACELYLETKGRLADATQSQYRNALEFWKGKFGADTRINLITHGKIAAAVGGHPWPSAKLCNNYLIPLRGTFNLAGREMRDVVNPIVGIENSKHQKTPPDPLTIVDMERILADMTERFHRQVAHYFTFAFLTGMRPEEIIALRWDDIDWNNRTICVSRAKTFKGGLKDLKTSEIRDVHLVDRAINMLQAQNRFTYMKRAEIFENPVTGRPWHDERSQRDHYWKPCLKKLGIRSRRAIRPGTPMRRPR